MSLQFSILIPVYHKESPGFLRTALDSVIQQTKPPSEILLVKDGPLTKDLDSLIEEYSLLHPTLFTVIALEKNCGMGVAMDVGVRACKFDWIARMDSDDISRPDRFQLQFDYIQDHPEVDIIGGGIEEFNINPHDLSRFRKVPVEYEEILRYSKYRNPMNHMTVLYKKSAVLSAGSYWERRYFEDYYLWCKMLQQGSRFYNLPAVLVDVRIGNNMVDRRRGAKYSKDEIFFLKRLKEEKYLKTLEYYRSVFIRTGLRYLPTRILGNFYDKILRQ